MTLHHHPHSSLQKDFWCTNAMSFLSLNSSEHASYRQPFWRGSLRQISLIPTIATITSHPIGGATAITITLHPLGCIIGIDGWGWVMRG
jgi:hypothetical protein